MGDTLSKIANETDGKGDVISLIGGISKIVGVLIGVIYVVGFLVVAIHLSRYSISGLSIFQLQYLVAGVWALGFPAAYICVRWIFGQVAKKLTPKQTSTYSLSDYPILTGVLVVGILALFFHLLNLSPELLFSMTGFSLIALYAFCLFLAVLAERIWLSRAASPPVEKWWGGQNALLLNTSLLVVTLLLYVFWFATDLYRLIPFSVGGGRPVTVVFTAGEKDLPDGLVREGTSKRSIPYKLLAMTDKSYVVASPEPGAISFEFNRDAVQGLVVIREGGKH